MKRRWTIAELKTLSDEEVLVGLTTERLSTLNPFAPLAKRLVSIRSGLEVKIAAGQVIKKPQAEWVKAPTDMVRSVYGCESHRCKNVTVTPDYHQNNGTPMCDCDRDMIFLRVEVATNF